MHIDQDTLVGAVIGSVSILPTSADDNVPFKAMVITIIDADDEPALTYQNYKFIQTEDLTKIGVAVHPYGAIIFNSKVTIPLMTGDELIVVEFNGDQYGATFSNLFDATGGQPVYFELIEDEDEGGGST